MVTGKTASLSSMYKNKKTKMEYFIIDNNGQQAGPFSQDQLVQKAISPETLVWKQGMADWTPAWKVEELRTVLEAVEANKTTIEAKTTEFGESLNTVEERVGTLEGQMVELSEADERLDDEIQEIKHHFSNKGSDTLIFATRQAFEQAELSPKTGDLIYILDEKKAYIY